MPPKMASQAVNTMGVGRKAAACLVGLAMCLLACNSHKNTPPRTGGEPAKEATSHLRADLAMARVDLAKQALARRAPEEALPLLVAAMEADPSCGEAFSMASNLLQSTRWLWPEATIRHPQMAIDSLHLDSTSSLWAALSLNDGTDLNSSVLTTVKWNLETLQIEAVLFPVRGHATSCLLLDPTHHYAVIKRSFNSQSDTVLLCHAQTLKPICNLGPLPDFITPSAAIVFSADGLLLAHPTFVSDTDRSIVWQLRDSESGEMIRTSDPIPPDQPSPLAAQLDHSRLRVMLADGKLLEMPVSPAKPASSRSILSPVHLVQARFREDGASVEALNARPSNSQPSLITLAIDANRSSDNTPAARLERFPWSSIHHPNIWNGLLREVTYNPLDVDQTRVTFPSLPFPSYDVNSSITAVALRGDRIAFGDINGTLNIYQTLPLPASRKGPDAIPPHTLAPADLTTIANLTDALTGCRYDATSRKLVRSDPAKRLQSCRECNPDDLSRIFPYLDFTTIHTRIQEIQHRAAAPNALLPVWDRLARADTTGKSWPKLLELAQDLSATVWHRELTAAVLARSAKGPVNPEASPWLAPLRIEKTFAQGEDKAIQAVIQASGNKGPAAAKALELALGSSHPEWIEACLAHAVDLPPLLRRLARSRVAWLQDRKADALADWPEAFPELAQIRMREDWDGWEQADIIPALEQLRRCVGEELAAIDVPPNSTPEQRQAIAARLSDPATLKAVGRARFAKACLKAALAFAAFKEENTNTFMLAARARELGEAPAPCLRAEAISLTALGDYQKARDRWISLITEHPVESQLPGDYAEASYTSFECADPRQAMAILTTGLHRYPNDANFALRAGWVALLTGNAERAYRFLLSGRQIGFPPEKLENATALLAIAAQQTGATEDAAAFYEDLIRLDPDWKNPGTLESLEWPDELKASLRQLVW